MIDKDVFAVDPWSITEREMHLDLLAETESLFALSNGHVGIRGNLDEGEPNAIPGTYLSGLFETVPLPYAEGAYGYPEEGQTMIDVINGKVMRLLVDDEPFDIRYGTLQRHTRTLDLRDGVLRREVEWTSPAGQPVTVRSTRLVSFVHRSIVAIAYEVEPREEPARIVVQSALVANEPVPAETDDPRAAAALIAPLVSEYHVHHDLGAALGHRTRASGLRVAAAMDHVVTAPADIMTEVDTEPDLARVSASTELEPGQVLRIVKFVGYGWSSTRTTPALRDQVDAAVVAAKRTGWDGLCLNQRRYLSEFWEGADVELDGDDALQQAVRYSIFQVLQSGARTESRAIGAKGLTGRGYDGHAFWDMDSYVLRVLSYTAPTAARDALRWRHSTLPLAQARAGALGLRGAAFPWRTIRGEECSAYWPAGTAAFHVNADIADAAHRYAHVSDDTEFAKGAGLELLVETARLWCSLGHHDAEGAFRIDGVTGPDEYSALGDNNVFTNLMAARNMRAADEAASQFPEAARALGVDEDERARWRAAADSVVVPYDRALGVTAQSEGFTRYRPWDFASTAPDQYPLLLHYPYYLLYSSQVVKQADLVLALYTCGDCFDDEQKARDFAYYEAITVRDSSLSASIQAIVAAEIGHVDLAYDYFRETSLVDLRDLAGNTASGLHLAALAGSWLVAVAGFGGLRDHAEVLAFKPRLPTTLSRLAFRLRYRDRQLHVEIRPDHASYELLTGEPLEIRHYGSPCALEVGTPQLQPISPVAVSTPVEQPPGRHPGGWE